MTEEELKDLYIQKTLKSTSPPTHCPHCDIRWEEEETVFEFFLKKYNDVVQATEVAKMYGCTQNTPQHFFKNVFGVEIQGKYDGILYWQCDSCHNFFDRGTLKKTAKCDIIG